MLRLFNALPFLQKNRNAIGLSHYEQFLSDFPDYASTTDIDQLRDVDFKKLDEQKHVYLDYTGGHLFGESQVIKHQEFLSSTILGNPHSINPSSALAESHIQATRQKVLDYFNAGDDYICIFTANASAAVKIVGECYPFTKEGQFLMTFDNHNSVNGIREFARAKGCPFQYSPLDEDLRIDRSALSKNLKQQEGNNKLFAFPAQSNVSGVKHNLEWIEEAQSLGWDVLLDAAAFVPSDRLDLLMHQPEFVAVSFYKIFGYPTGLGALLVKKTAFEKLKKPSFAGGTITIVSVQGDGHYLEKEAARFEEGTVNYLDIPAIKTGLEYIEAIGIQQINTRVACLTEYLLRELVKLRHKNGQRLIEIYGPQNGENRGGTLAMNFYDSFGRLHDFISIEQAAFEQNISLRTGCFCNPGIDETNHQLKAEKLQAYFRQDGAKDYFNLIEFMGQKRGAVRVSIGYVTNFNDLQVFLDFCRTLLNKEAG
ncbi:MAG: aminotransferase class V-fold PLP-dependent enzyme [Roseivirga sp.]|nr:aminotransferase class V-fold PLP-dependent enzyme [Roseivirga sp.]